MINQKTTGKSLMYLRGAPQTASNVQYNATAQTAPGQSDNEGGDASAKSFFGQVQANADAYDAQVKAKNLANAQQYCKDHPKSGWKIYPEVCPKPKAEWWQRALDAIGGGLLGFVVGGPVGAIAGATAADQFSDEIWVH